MTTPIDEAIFEDVGLIKAQIFSDARRVTRQIADDSLGFVGPVINPMYDPRTWANMLAQSSRLSRAIRVLARNTVGLGYYFAPKQPEDTLDRRQRDQFEREAERLNRLFEYPNPEQSTPELFECMKIDEEATGDGWIEVTRNEFGRINGLFHMPSPTMRITTMMSPTNMRLLLQSRAGGTYVRYFRVFGDPSNLNPITGRPDTKVNTASYKHEAVPLPWNQQASEVLHTRIYTPDDDWYGAPRFVSAAPAIATTRMGQQWNMNFLGNSAHMPYAVIVEGGNLSPDSRRLITEFIDREGKGVKNAGRVMLLEPALENIPAAARQNIRIRLEKLSIGLADDGSFLKLRDADNEEIREVLGTAKIMLGTFDDANKSNAVIALRVTVQQEIEPDICRKEHMINSTVVRDMGAKYARFRFVRPKILDPLQDASVVQKLMSAYSINELREIAGQLRGQRLGPIDHPLARLPQGFFKDQKFLDAADKLVEEITTRTKERAGRAPEVETGDNTSGDPSGTSLLPSEFADVEQKIRRLPARTPKKAAA